LLFTTNLGFREHEGAQISYLDPPPRHEFIEGNESRLETVIKNGSIDENGRVRPGSPALWSRLQSSLIGYDLLRPAAIEEIVVVSCQRLEENLADEFDIQVSLASEEFAPVIGAKAMEKKKWDGRSVYPKVQQFIEGPVRDELLKLEEGRGLSPGSEVRFVPGGDGRAMLL